MVAWLKSNWQVVCRAASRPASGDLLPLLRDKGAVTLGDDRIFVSGLEGPLQDGWEVKVDAFAAGICASRGRGEAAPAPPAG
jgi:hypothetical protein